jgi:hypothetical protein
MTVINVMAWGDFDMKYTFATMVCPYQQSVESLKKQFLAQEGIYSFSGHSYDKCTELTEKFVKFLKKNDFKNLEGEEVCFSD